MNGRKLFRVVHRDIGYAIASLVIAYSISGIAVNHIDDWNPNYSMHRTAVDVGPLPRTGPDAMEAHVIDALSLDPKAVRGRVMDSETAFRLFLQQGGEVRVDVRNGKGHMKRVDTRWFLHEANALHLNSIKGAWTWVADIFAVALLVLALTGISIHKGRQGLAGRGKWFAGAGFAIPVLFILYMYYGG